MRRNKTAKRAASKPRQARNTSSLNQLEKDYLTAPAKLAAQIAKEISASRQQENKLKKAVNKAQAQVKAADARVKNAAKVKTAAGKKQLNTAKKVHGEAVRIQATLGKQLQEVSKTLNGLFYKQDKFTTIGKYVSQFDKQWAKDSKKASVKAKSKAKTQTKKAKSKTQPHQQVQQFDNIETVTFDTVRLDEPTEMAS